jgi:hypothetical protein
MLTDHLDPDVAEWLIEYAARTGNTVTEAVNHLLLEALAADERDRHP